MAVDTKDKRFSMMNLSSPRHEILIDPDGSIDAGNRSHFLGLYSGITLDGPVAPSGQKTSLMLLGVGM